MRNLSRAVFDDAMEMTLRSERLSDAQKADLIERLRRVRDGMCDERAGCAGCPEHCACEDLVRRVFAEGAARRMAG